MKKISTIVIFVLLFLICFPVKGEMTKPSTIRIGLFFDSNAKQTYRLQTDGGFILGIKKDGNFIELLKTKDTSITVDCVEPDKFIIERDGLESFEKALSYIKDSSIEKYVFYDNGWGVLSNNGSGALKNSYLIKIKSSIGTILIPLKMSEPVYFSSANSNSPVSLDGKRYRGLIEFIPGSKGTMTAVNELDLEEYLYGVLPKEMPAGWPIEALKAQAVAARTYAVYNLCKWEKSGFDLCAGSADQYYGGYDEEMASTNEAVDETRGEIALYEGKPIIAFYHSDSGGITEDNADVSEKEFPYLKPVKDEFGKESPYADWCVSFSAAEIENKIGDLRNAIGQVTDIYVTQKSASGRAKTVVISGTRGKVEVTGTQLRNMLGLNSTLFDINGGDATTLLIAGSNDIMSAKTGDLYLLSSSRLTSLKASREIFLQGGFKLKEIDYSINEDFKFTGHGRGHGIGLSQWGARGMAEQGYNYIEILQHYYKNVEIGN